MQGIAILANGAGGVTIMVLGYSWVCPNTFLWQSHMQGTAILANGAGGVTIMHNQSGTSLTQQLSLNWLIILLNNFYGEIIYCIA